MRLQKDFNLAKDVRLSFFVDALNLLNEDVWESVGSSTVTSSLFNEPIAPVFPRRFMFGAKFRF
jgi:hypothetical protein